MKLVPTVSALSMLSLASCNGTVIMSPLSPEQLDANYKAGIDVRGIIVLRSIQKVEVDQFIQFNVPINPKLAPSAGNTTISNDCSPVEVRKVVTVADTAHPYRLHYEHGILETYTFGATLSQDGVLLGINTVSTPDQGKTISNLTTAAAAAAGIKAFDNTAPSKPPCTITPAFEKYEPI